MIEVDSDANSGKDSGGVFAPFVVGAFGVDGIVCVEALERAGKCRMLKGHIQEILFRNNYNLAPSNWLSGRFAELVSNPTSRTADIVVKQAGRIVDRFQVKDVESAGGISRVLKRIRAGQYNGTSLYMSPESVDALRKANYAGRVQSTGISSANTRSLAHRVGATGAGTLGEAALTAAARSGLVGAVVIGGFTLLEGAVQLYQGNVTLLEVTQMVVRETLGGGISCAAGGAAATVAGACTAAISPTAAAIVSTVVAIGVAIAIKKYWDELNKQQFPSKATAPAQ